MTFAPHTVTETVWPPALTDVARASEMLEYRFKVVPRLLVATNTPIFVQRREIGTATALIALLALLSHLWLAWPLLPIKLP